MRTATLVTTLSVAATAIISPALADEITYRKHVRPLWEQKCMSCHGATAPTLGAFEDDKDKFTKMMVGPRMNDYANLVAFVGWPDTGALMRRLDDGKGGKSGKPGNMYVYLGGNEAERQKNLALIKSWVGEGAWFLGRFGELDKATLQKIKVRE